jgi:hypothetical protein
MNCSDYKYQGLGECSNIQLPKTKYKFTDGKCFSNDCLLGDIIERNENQIKVIHKNGSFADGTIHTFNFIL